MITLKTRLLIILLLGICVTSCSQASSPVTMGQISTISYSNIPVGVSDWDILKKPSAGMGMLGLFSLHVDPVNVKAEFASLRSGALTDVLEVVDITNFLMLAPCVDCAKIESISLDEDSNPVVSIGIKHPFDAGDPLKPISGRNRGDLHVFNVEGIVISNSDGSEFPDIGENISGISLLSADGYTGYLDDSLDDIFPTDATIHPYILHFDDYSAGNFDPANPMGF